MNNAQLLVVAGANAVIGIGIVTLYSAPLIVPVVLIGFLLRA